MLLQGCVKNKYTFLNKYFALLLYVQYIYLFNKIKKVFKQNKYENYIRIQE